MGTLVFRFADCLRQKMPEHLVMFCLMSLELLVFSSSYPY